MRGSPWPRARPQPAVLLCIAKVATHLLGNPLDHSVAMPLLIVTTIASPVVGVMSFVVAPARSMSLRLECMRLGWTLLWIAAFPLVVLAILAATLTAV